MLRPSGMGGDCVQSIVSEAVGRSFWLEVPVDMHNTAYRSYTFTSHHCSYECSPGMGRANADVNFRKSPDANQPGIVDMQQEIPNLSQSHRRVGQESCSPDVSCKCGQLMGVQSCTERVHVLQKACRSSCTICGTWEKSMSDIRCSRALPHRSWGFSASFQMLRKSMEFLIQPQPCRAMSCLQFTSDHNYCSEILIR